VRSPHSPAATAHNQLRADWAYSVTVSTAHDYILDEHVGYWRAHTAPLLKFLRGFPRPSPALQAKAGNDGPAYSCSTRRLLVTENAPGTLLAWTSAICLSICRATTPSKVIWPRSTMM
jgi:hypothetical protein